MIKITLPNGRYIEIKSAAILPFTKHHKIWKFMMKEPKLFKKLVLDPAERMGISEDVGKKIILPAIGLSTLAGTSYYLRKSKKRGKKKK